MARTIVRLPLPKKTETSIPSRGKERREPIVVEGEYDRCPDCGARLDANDECSERVEMRERYEGSY